MVSLNIKKIFIYLGIVLVIFFLDRISKIYILNIAESEGIVEINADSKGITPSLRGGTTWLE